MTPYTKKITAIALMVLALLIGACFFGRHLLSDLPFFAHAFDGPTAVFGGESGRTYLIDNGKKSVLILNEAGELTRVIDQADDGFYYASLVCDDGDGLYIADTLYSGAGTRLLAERVFRYEPDGSDPRLVYAIQYDDPADAPLQYGDIRSMRVTQGRLRLARLTKTGLSVIECDLASGEVRERPFDLPGVYLSDVDLDPNTGLPVYVTRLGEVCALGADGSVQTLLPAESGRTAWRVCCDGKALYVTDLAANQLIGLDLNTGEQTALIVGGDILYTAHEANGRVYSTDYMGYYVHDLATGTTRYSTAAPLAQRALRTLLWLALLAGVLDALFLLTLFVIRPLMGQRRNATVQRVTIVLVVSACIGVMVGFTTLNNSLGAQHNAIMEQLSLFNDILVESTNVAALRELDSLSDYKSAAYERVKGPLDALVDMTYRNGLYYYYAIYVTDGEVIYGVLDYEDTMTTRHPFYPYGTQGYTEPFEGETVQVSADVSSYGSWSFILKPIYDGDEVAAIMEVGVNLDDVQAQMSALIWRTILITGSTVVVLLMLIIETLFYIEHREKRSRIDVRGRPLWRFPLRTLIFITFLADCMQDAFVSILAKSLYVPIYGIPESVGAALPISVQVLAAALSAFAFGGLLRQVGSRTTMGGGYVLQIAGFIVCAVTSSYAGLIGGKLLIGVGIGLVIVSVTAIAASGGNLADSAQAFAAVSAGTLAGVTAGAGVGSIILSFGSFSSVYYTGALILVLGLAMSVTGADHRETASVKTRDRLGYLRLFSDKRVLSFLLLILMPFLIALSFREYFFPIYAAENGLSGADIGRIYLLCGLVNIYAGPLLTRSLIQRLGSKWTMVTASVLMLGATLTFALVPTLAASIVGLALLSVSVSFGYAAQSTYYAGLESVGQVGESRSMGVYSLVDNGGQTLGPVIYGVAMLSSYREGLLIIGAAMAALILLFLAINGFGRGDGAQRTESRIQEESADA